MYDSEVVSLGEIHNKGSKRRGGGGAKLTNYV